MSIVVGISAKIDAGLKYNIKTGQTTFSGGFYISPFTAWRIELKNMADKAYVEFGVYSAYKYPIDGSEGGFGGGFYGRLVWESEMDPIMDKLFPDRMNRRQLKVTWGVGEDDAVE